jgi:hypothetical protein
MIDRSRTLSLTRTLALAHSPTINALLDTFTAWRASAKPTSRGIWHHFTDCYPPPGTVGLAWIGASFARARFCLLR